MSANNITTKAPYLRTSRHFPEDAHQLVVEVNKSYVDIANAINNRTISIFPSTRSIANGENWYVNQDQKQQGIRQVYPFTSAGNIPHGIKTTQISGFTRIYGTFTDGTIWYPLPYVSVTAANNQVNVIVNATNIVITAGGGSPPTIVSGWVVLEWISLV